MAKKLSVNELTALQSVVNLFRAIDVSSIFNSYAIENVIFGDLKQGDKIPFEKFVGIWSWQHGNLIPSENISEE